MSVEKYYTFRIVTAIQKSKPETLTFGPPHVYEQARRLEDPHSCKYHLRVDPGKRRQIFPRQGGLEVIVELERAIPVLASTPATLRAMLGELPEDWTAGRGGVEDWQPYDVVGHLIHGEETDWIPRARIILEQGENRTFVPFDRFAQAERSQGKSLSDLLAEFEYLRERNLAELRSWNLAGDQLDLKGMHPELGEVTLRQLLATWVVHDLNHIRQIATAMARRYETEVGPWKEYLSILQ